MKGALLNTDKMSLIGAADLGDRYRIVAYYDINEDEPFVIFSYDSAKKRDDKMEELYEKLRS